MVNFTAFWEIRRDVGYMMYGVKMSQNRLKFLVGIPPEILEPKNFYLNFATFSNQNQIKSNLLSRRIKMVTNTAQYV